LLRQALAPGNIPVLGALRREAHFTWRDRHLGLIPVVEQPREVTASLDRLAAAVAAGVDLDLVMRVAREAPCRSVAALPGPSAPARTAGCRIAVASGPAFSFGYVDNLELLAAAGAELVPFDPLRDPALPESIGGLVVGGGFPEVYAEALAGNRPLRDDTRRRVEAGLVTWAECGGLLWLGEELDGYPQCGVIGAHGVMTDHLALGYRTATFCVDTPLAAEGTVVRGHEFHYSRVTPAGHALSMKATTGAEEIRGGWASSTLLASFLHLHLAGAPQLATELVRRAAQYSGPVR
jgi:cobyrinic acid a,c-diamide synthase